MAGNVEDLGLDLDPSSYALAKNVAEDMAPAATNPCLNIDNLSAIRDLSFDTLNCVSALLSLDGREDNIVTGAISAGN